MKNNKLEEVSKGNPVALYIKYEEGDLNEMMKKVEILEKYCKEKNYNIIKKVFWYIWLYRTLLYKQYEKYFKKYWGLWL